MSAVAQPISGHVFRVERHKGPVWFCKYRLPDGRQLQKRIGPAWTGRGRPAAGYFTKRMAEDWLRGVLDEARRGTLPGLVRTGVSFEEAAAEWLRYLEHDRQRKPSTMVHYRSIVSHHLLPEFGRYAIEDVTTEMIEDWLRPSEGSPATRLKNFVALSGIFRRARKVWRLPVNPATDVERPPVGQSGDIEVFSPEEVWALVRPRRASRTARSISRPRSPGCGWVSCWR